MCSLTRSKAVLRVADGKLGFYTWQFDTGARIRNWHQLNRSVPGFGSLFSIPLSYCKLSTQTHQPHTFATIFHPDSPPEENCYVVCEICPVAVSEPNSADRQRLLVAPSRSVVACVHLVDQTSECQQWYLRANTFVQI